MSSHVLEAPKPEIFDKVGYFDKRVLGANVVRWVFNPLDVIVPQRKAEISWLKVGGEETSCLCLQRYGRGFIPRGLASILEMGGEPIPMQHLGDLQASAWSGIPLNDGLSKSNFGYVPVFPGDGLRVLRRYSMNDGGMRKGIDELTSLVGKEWEEAHNDEKTGILDVLERDFFGDGISPTLRGLEDQIRYGKTSETRIDVGKYQTEALVMCEDARNWAVSKISWEHSLLKSPTIPMTNDAVGQRGGWSYAYSPMVELLLAQLEVSRQDQPLNEMAKMVERLSLATNQNVQPQGISAVDMEMFERKMEEKLSAARAADAARIAELEAKLAAPAEVATYICEHCNEEVKVAGKGFHIGRHCKVLNPKTETE